MKFYKCCCHGEAISFEYDKEFNHFELAFWNMGPQGVKYSLFQKLRICWNLLFKGKLYSDMVILDSCTALDLARDIMFNKENI